MLTLQILMTPKSDCILHPVDFLRVHQIYVENLTILN